MKGVLIHHSEISLKGRNRKLFEKILLNNIRDSIKNYDIKRLEGRFVIYLDKFNHEIKNHIHDKLSKIFGISWFSFSDIIETDLNKIKLQLKKIKIPEGKSFRIETIRAYKGFPYSSLDTNKLLGEFVLKFSKAKVSLKNPDIKIFVEITKEKTFIYTEKFKGLYGLPVGSSGKVLCLFSGGIDSTVASWLMMKRGCNIDYLHFHSMRKNDEVKLTKVYKLYNLLKEFDPSSRLFLLPFHNFDISVQKVYARYHLILFRRFMFKIAEILAKKIGANAIVVGDSLGQVASQTLESIKVSDESVSLPVFRPLVGMNKEEIIDIAKKIGSYELSIESYKDCCSIVSKHPITKPNLEKVKLFEKEIDMDKIIKVSLNQLEEIKKIKSILNLFGC